MKKLLLVVLACLISFNLYADTNPRAQLETNMGIIELELYPEKAPLSVANFIRYINEGFYDNTMFHRVIPKFMIQGGGFSADFDHKQTHLPIDNEANNGLKNEHGTVAMARTNDPHSATAQFFINTANNAFLNHSSKSMRGWGYAVFGKVTKGMDVVTSIEQIKTGPGGVFPTDVPQTPVIITKARVLPLGAK